MLMCLNRILKRFGIANTTNFGKDVFHTQGFECIHTNIRIFFLKFIHSYSFGALIRNASKTYDIKCKEAKETIVVDTWLKY